MTILTILAFVCFFIGIVQLLTGPSETPAQMPDKKIDYNVLANLMSVFDTSPTGKQAAAAQFNNPPPAPESFRRVAAQMPGSSSAPSNPNKLASIQVGDRIRVRHPQRGELTLFVDGRILYQELWQEVRSAQSPWVPTGNTFAGFWLETGIFLLNWQNRFYVLDEAVPLSDADIQTNFMPYARQFAQSDQKADVYFAYPPASWHMDDIGKFRVSAVQGSGLRLQVGAVGRFIHASSSEGRGLVVEDHQGEAPGEDTAWVGWMVKAEEINY